MKKSSLVTRSQRLKQGLVLVAVVLAAGCGGGGGGGGGSGSAASDTTPSAFTFAAQANVVKSTVVTSAAMTVAGINAASAISITGGTYQVGGAGTWSSVDSTVTVGQTVMVRHTSSSSSNTATNTVLIIGTVSGTFTSTTKADPVAGISLPNQIDIVDTD